MTIATYCRDFPPETDIDWDEEEEIVSDLVLLGIVGIQDPVRPEVRFIVTNTGCAKSSKGNSGVK